jgi:hypothetical protein
MSSAVHWLCLLIPPACLPFSKTKQCCIRDKECERKGMGNSRVQQVQLPPQPVPKDLSCDLLILSSQLIQGLHSYTHRK